MWAICNASQMPKNKYVLSTFTVQLVPGAGFEDSQVDPGGHISVSTTAF